MIATDTNDTGEMERLIALNTEMSDRMARMTTVVERLERRVDVLGELLEDLMPMANGMFGMASRKLEAWEGDGVLDFGKESVKLLETVATSFSAEDVQLLSQNLVGILETVRNMTQPDVMDAADRAVTAFREAEAKPPEKVRLFKALRDPEIRRGMGLMLSVLREMGSDNENETNEAPAMAGEAT